MRQDEAIEDLRQIRETMKRSSRYSNFAGLSGVVGGIVALAGLITETKLNSSGWPFIGHWTVVIAVAMGFDWFWTRRRTRTEDKAVVRRLSQRMAVAALPGLAGGLALTLAFVSQGRTGELFPYWMLAYGVAMSAVGLMSPPEVTWMARAFLVAGAVTLAGKVGGFQPAGMLGFAASFGLFHIIYGIYVGVREGW